MKTITLDRLQRNELIRRDDLHRQLGGNRKSTVSPSKRAGGLFLFSADAAAAYGIQDGWRGPNEFEFCVVVDDPGQEWDTASRAIRDHQRADRRLYVFRMENPELCRFQGRFEHRGYRTEAVTDRFGRTRTAVVFTLRESRLILDMAASDHSLVDSAMRMVAERLRREQADFVGPVPLPATSPSSAEGEFVAGRLHRRTMYVRFPESSTIVALADIPLPTGIEIEMRQE